MRRRFVIALFALAWLASSFAARADITHQPVFFEGRVGPYETRVVIRPPGVIPGLAEVTVRVLEGQPEVVTALPMKWDTGRRGAPPPDVARPVRGEEKVYAANLWLMERGAHGVEVALKGREGAGSVIIPFNSTATRVIGLPRLLGVLLAGCGAALVALFVSIVGSAVRESCLAPGISPSRRRVWVARGASGAALLLMGAGLWGGWRWWQAEAAHYRNNRLYRPVPISAWIEETPRGPEIRLDINEEDPRRAAPLVPDHGRLMHVFLIEQRGLNALAHLHPVRIQGMRFRAPLPDLPPGEYSLYAQITRETGFSQTLTNRVQIPDRGSAEVQDSDPDDACWTASAPGQSQSQSRSSAVITESSNWTGVYPIDADLRMKLALSEPCRRGRALSLRFELTNAEGRPEPLQPYLGMMGHLAVRDARGTVFSHGHPTGSFSMAAQQLFEQREAGKAPWAAAFGADDPICSLPPVENATADWLARQSDQAVGVVSFPYEFIASGRHRLWAQVRARGRIHTAAFDIIVP